MATTMPSIGSLSSWATTTRACARYSAAGPFTVGCSASGHSVGAVTEDRPPKSSVPPRAPARSSVEHCATAGRLLRPAGLRDLGVRRADSVPPCSPVSKVTYDAVKARRLRPLRGLPTADVRPQRCAVALVATDPTTDPGGQHASSTASRSLVFLGSCCRSDADDAGRRRARPSPRMTSPNPVDGRRFARRVHVAALGDVGHRSARRGGGAPGGHLAACPSTSPSGAATAISLVTLALLMTATFVIGTRARATLGTKEHRQGLSASDSTLED